MARSTKPQPRTIDVTPTVPIGAAFGVPIEGDRFGVCRVISRAHERDAAKIFASGRAARAAVLVLATRWTGTRAQLDAALGDPRVREPLRLTHHTWRNRPYVVLVTDPPPANFVPLGESPPSALDAKLRNAYYAWASLPTQYQSQLAWEDDPAGVRARDTEIARRQRESVERERVDGKSQPARQTRAGKPTSLGVLARRTPFADWREPLRGRARERVAKLITTLRSRERSVCADLRTIVSCARSFNREREIGTLEAESLDEALLSIACAVDIDADTYGRAIDRIRDW